MQSEHHLGHGYLICKLYLIGKLYISTNLHHIFVYRFIKINAVDETNNFYAVMTAN